MRIHEYWSLMIVAAAGSVAAQAATTTCSSGPGSVYGVRSIQCGNCRWQQENGRWTSTFFAEPVVTQVAPRSEVETGDVVEAVDGNPITTQAGADAFAYPKAGDHVLTVRRGRERREIRVSVGATCSAGFGGSA